MEGIYFQISIWQEGRMGGFTHSSITLATEGILRKSYRY